MTCATRSGRYRRAADPVRKLSGPAQPIEPTSWANLMTGQGERGTQGWSPFSYAAREASLR